MRLASSRPASSASRSGAPTAAVRRRRRRARRACRGQRPTSRQRLGQHGRRRRRRPRAQRAPAPRPGRARAGTGGAAGRARSTGRTSGRTRQSAHRALPSARASATRAGGAVPAPVGDALAAARSRPRSSRSLSAWTCGFQARTRRSRSRRASGAAASARPGGVGPQVPVHDRRRRRHGSSQISMLPAQRAADRPLHALDARGLGSP